MLDEEEWLGTPGWILCGYSIYIIRERHYKSWKEYVKLEQHKECSYIDVKKKTKCLTCFAFSQIVRKLLTVNQTENSVI